MKTLIHKKNGREIKIQTLRDIKYAKKMYRYEMEISSQELTNSYQRMKYSFGEMVKNPLKDITHNVIYSVVMNMLKSRK
jgi:hypothetical protein